MTDTQETGEIQEVEQVSLQDDIESALSEQNEETVAETVEEETVQEVLESLEAPQYWDKRTKELFNEWAELERGREYQQAMLEQYGKTESYTNEKKREAAQYREQVEGWNNVFQPYQEFINVHGLTPQEAARRGVGIMTNINQDPQKFALDILQRMNYDFASHGQDAPYVPPEVQKLQQELAGLKNALQSQTQEQQQRAYQEHQARLQRETDELNQKIQSFASEKDAGGNLLYPHFKTAEPEMAKLVFGYRGRNEPIPELPKLYEEACYLNHDLRAKMQAETAQKETARKSAEAKKAINAGKRVDGKPTGGEAQRTLKEEIAANLNAA